MYRAMLQAQWSWARLELGVYAVVAFFVPTAVMRIMTSGMNDSSIDGVLSASAGTGGFLGAIAFIAGVTLACRPWIADQSRGHVFALSLPVSWPHYVRLRFICGATLIAIPALAAWLGALLGVLTYDVPGTLRAYPLSLALRFAGAAMVFYSLAFAIQYLAGRKAAHVMAGALLFWLTAEVIGQAFGLGSFTVGAWHMMSTWPGPFEVVTARWMLIDV